MTKKEIIDKHILLLKDKIDVYEDMMQSLALDANNDTKGSAGDKHETARAMMHIEQEKIFAKINEFQSLLAILQSIDANKTNNIVTIGSLVFTNKFCFLIAAALPKLEMNGQTIYTLSPDAPLGSLLMHKKENDVVVLQKNEYLIQKIM